MFSLVPTPFSFPLRYRPARYDYVEVEDLTEKTVLGRWCGSQSAPVAHTSKGNQLRIHFVSDEYFPSEPGFCIRYSLLPLVRKSSTLTSSHKQKHTKLQSVSWRSCSFMTDSKGHNYNFVTVPLVEICIFCFSVIEHIMPATTICSSCCCTQRQKHKKPHRHKRGFYQAGFPNPRFHNLHQFPEQMKDINGAISPRCRLISPAAIASV